MKLYLHIGTHKTGTTAFQKTLALSQHHLLNKDNIKFIDINKIGFVKLQKLMLTQAYDKYFVDEIKTFVTKEIDPNCEKYICSFEGFSGNPLSYYDNAYNVAKVLYYAFSDVFDTEVLVALRRQDEFLSSMYTQQLHEGKVSKIEDFILPDKLSFLDWNKFLEPYGNFFGKDKIKAFPYDKQALQKNSIINLFNSVIKSTVLALDHYQSNQNIGFSTLGSRVASLCMDYLSDSEKILLRGVLQENANKGILKEYNILSIKLKSEIVDFFDDSNDYLAKNFFSKTFPITNFSPPNFQKDERDLSDSDMILRLQFVSLVKLINQKNQEIESLKNILPIRLYLKLARIFTGR